MTQTLQQILAAPENALTILMSRVLVPWSMRLTDEDRLCIEFADRMRQHTLQGRYKGEWVHIPNQGKRHNLVAILLKAMGLIPGASDYVFTWPGGHGWLEAKLPERIIAGNATPVDYPGKRGRKPKKRAETKQSDPQKNFQAWCDANGSHYAIFRTVEEGEAILRSWGALV